MKEVTRIKKKIQKLIMVTPTLSTECLDGKKRPILDEYWDWEFDFSSIKNNVESITLLADEKDDIVPMDQQRELAEKLSATLDTVVGNKPHFNDSEEPQILNTLVSKIPIFTTRADTLYGVTFMVFAPEHPYIAKWVKGTNYEKDFKNFLNSVLISGSLSPYSTLVFNQVSFEPVSW